MTRYLFVLLTLLWVLTAPVQAQVSGPWARVVFGSDTGPTIRSGTGSPEGVVTASGGSLYLQTDGAVGLTLWTKVGAGNTGWAAPSSGSSAVVQVVNTQTGSAATGSVAIPLDDTIPQNTEGTEFLTLAITPTNAGNKLRIDVSFFVTAAGAPVWLIGALFQDSTADALAVGANFNNVTTAGSTVTFSHTMTAGTTSATTFKLRAGCHDTTTMTFNGNSGTRLWGGVAASSITITEYVP